MKIVKYTAYGAPDVLQISEMEKPAPKDNEVQIRVNATSVTATECTFRKGEPLFSRLFTNKRIKINDSGNRFHNTNEYSGMVCPSIPLIASTSNSANCLY